MGSSDGYGGLRYHTRGGANPQGRPRVYFCCHPDDFSVYFESIVAEIQNIQTNAAIWYYDPAEGVPDAPEFLEDLRGMQLFVIPVTSRFVYRESHARELELPLAVEAHIPILPIMQEDIPNRDFSEACGSLQTLNRYTSMSDPTAIPYEERLRKFLQSVLVGDELAERVRAAFDAYVFLSYRKKDRAQAQRIMRLIHESPFCRDIAIWYDEFLVLGEDFHDAIREAIKKCSVFSLVVTPRLLEPGNFVMREEYPTARDSGKPVVPVEAVETDHGELADAYRGIGDTVPADDREGLSSHLLDSLRGVALRENDQDPQHNFFIGLAYLTGIDVEVDHGRALALITSSAEAGLPEAYERLVAMYNTGEGVGRDYRKAIEWQERYVGMLRERTAASPGQEEEVYSLLYSLEVLGDMHFDAGNPKAALTAYGELLDITERSRKTPHVSVVWRYMLASLFRLGNAQRALGNLIDALGFYERALGLSVALAMDTGTSEERRNLSVVLTNVGDIWFELGEYAGALDDYKKAHEIDMALDAEMNTVQTRRDLSTSYGRIGKALFNCGDTAGGARVFRKGACNRYRSVRGDRDYTSTTGSSRIAQLGGRCKVGDG